MATVAEVREVPQGSPLSGVHLVAKTESETIEVYLGPANFLEELAVQLCLITTGFRLSDPGSSSALASSFGRGVPARLARVVHYPGHFQPGVGKWDRLCFDSLPEISRISACAEVPSWGA